MVNKILKFIYFNYLFLLLLYFILAKEVIFRLMKVFIQYNLDGLKLLKLCWIYMISDI